MWRYETNKGGSCLPTYPSQDEWRMCPVASDARLYVAPRAGTRRQQKENGWPK
jgi:hypothetical protein